MKVCPGDSCTNTSLQEQTILRPLPFVSIVMPIRNEGPFLERSLAAILAQNYPLDRMELLIADGMSQDATSEIVTGFAHRHPELSIVLLDNPANIVPAGLNLAIRKARGEIIARIDGHALVESDYIAQAVATLVRTGADNVGGLMRPIGTGWIGRSIALAHNLRFGLGGGSFHIAKEETEADTVYLGIFRRDVFVRVGLFDEELARNQDIELNGRIRKAGGRIILSPRIRSAYHCRSSLRKLWTQNYANGLWLFVTARKTFSALSFRHYVPLLFVLTLFAGVILSLMVPGAWVLPATIMLTYAIVCAATSFAAGVSSKWSFAFSLPIVFVTLHFSYGIGSLVGLFTFVLQRNRTARLGPPPRTNFTTLR